MDKDSALLLNAGAHYIKVLLRQFDDCCQHNSFKYKTHYLSDTSFSSKRPYMQQVPIVGRDE